MKRGGGVGGGEENVVNALEETKGKIENDRKRKQKGKSRLRGENRNVKC